METKKELIEKRNKLQEQIDNFKEVLEVGKWYKYIGKYKGAIVNYQGGEGAGYGVNSDFDWQDHTNYIDGDIGISWSFSSEPKKWIPATDKAVEEVLIKEAKKRGFKEGVKINCVLNQTNAYRGFNIGSKFKLIGNDFWARNDCGDGNYSFCLFSGGKWASIIEDKVPEINGYQLELIETDRGDVIKFGCAEFHKNFFGDILYCHENYEGMGNRKIKSITLDSGVEITVEQLKEVVDYLNK